MRGSGGEVSRRPHGAPSPLRPRAPVPLSNHFLIGTREEESPREAEQERHQPRQVECVGGNGDAREFGKLVDIAEAVGRDADGQGTRRAWLRASGSCGRRAARRSMTS
jgi:hypothetical protein